MAGDDDHHRARVVGPIEELVEEVHRVRRVGERGEARAVQCTEEHAGGESGRFERVVVFCFAAVGLEAVTLDENGKLLWTAEGPDGTLTWHKDPGASTWQRIMLRIMGWIPMGKEL